MLPKNHNHTKRMKSALELSVKKARNAELLFAGKRKQSEAVPFTKLMTPSRAKVLNSDGTVEEPLDSDSTVKGHVGSRDNVEDFNEFQKCGKYSNM